MLTAKATVAYSCQHPPPTPTIPAPVYVHANPLCGCGCVADCWSELGMLAQRNTHTHTHKVKSSRLCVSELLMCVNITTTPLQTVKHVCHLQNICVPLYGTMLSSLRFVCGSDVECTTRQLQSINQSIFICSNLQ